MSNGQLSTEGAYFALAFCAFILGACLTIFVFARGAAVWFRSMMSSRYTLDMARSRERAIARSTPRVMRTQALFGLVIALILGFNLVGVIAAGSESLVAAAWICLLAVFAGGALAAGVGFGIASRSRALTVTERQRAWRAPASISFVFAAVVLFVSGLVVLA